MESLSFLVQGSATEPYQVSFRKDGHNLSASCTCPAGAIGQYCKHRFNILDGVLDGIVSNNENEVVKVAEWLKGTDVESALNAVTEAEQEAERAKQRLSKAKKHLAAAMRD